MRKSANRGARSAGIIGDIYDASLDAALWPQAFNRIRDFLGDCTATLISQDAITKNIDFHFMLGHDQGYVGLFLERYFKINPLFPPAMFLDVERIQTVSDAVPLQEFCRSRFAEDGLYRRAFATACSVVSQCCR
jgi:hypothetical protein